MKRWPTHRQQGDARFAELERRANELEVKVAQLESVVATLVSGPRVAPPPTPQPVIDSKDDPPPR